MSDAAPTVALLYPGDRAARQRADPGESRFAALFAAFGAAGVRTEPAIWHDDFAAEVRAQLLRVQAVLVWCNPIEGGRRRDRLDALLHEVAAAGVFVSAHPETIERLGTKDVLVACRGLPFGSDTRRVDSLAQLAAELPARLQRSARVLKQHRGHGGIGVWRIEQAAPGRFQVRHAQRGSESEALDLPALLARLAPYFEPEAGGHMIDQPWQPRVTEGMVRAYLVEDRVAGFGHQAINALHPTVAQPGPRVYYGPGFPAFQSLRHQLESGWVTMLRRRVGLEREELPLLWDCDFFLGAPGDAQPFVLCEVNCSSVSPFPPASIAPLVDAVKRRVAAR